MKAHRKGKLLGIIRTLIHSVPKDAGYYNELETLCREMEAELDAQSAASSKRAKQARENKQF